MTWRCDMGVAGGVKENPPCGVLHPKNGRIVVLVVEWWVVSSICFGSQAGSYHSWPGSVLLLALRLVHSSSHQEKSERDGLTRISIRSFMSGCRTWGVGVST